MKTILTGALIFLCGIDIERAFPQAPFFADKTINVVLGGPPAGSADLRTRAVINILRRHIPGNPNIIVQNMPGAGHMIAPNYLYNVAKPDGLTLGAINAGQYFEQLAGRAEVKFDWTKYAWIGNATKSPQVLYMRADSPFKTIEDVRTAKEPPKCGTTGVGGSDYVVSRILEETIGAKMNQVVGYPGSSEIAIAVERGEVQCQGLTIQTFFGREPFLSWVKNNFVRFLAQTGRKRDPRVNGPTIFELMDEYKTPTTKRRLAEAMLSGGEWARPMLVAPATPPERVQMLRDAYDKAAQDPELLAEAKKLRMDIQAGKGTELQAMAKDAMNQPAEVIEQIKKLFVQQ